MQVGAVLALVVAGIHAGNQVTRRTFRSPSSTRLIRLTEPGELTKLLGDRYTHTFHASSSGSTRPVRFATYDTHPNDLNAVGVEYQEFSVEWRDEQVFDIHYVVHHDESDTAYVERFLWLLDGSLKRQSRKREPFYPFGRPARGGRGPGVFP
jgi:hypothetical protein